MFKFMPNNTSMPALPRFLAAPVEKLGEFLAAPVEKLAKSLFDRPPDHLGIHTFTLKSKRRQVRFN